MWTSESRLLTRHSARWLKALRTVVYEARYVMDHMPARHVATACAPESVEPKRGSRLTAPAIEAIANVGGKAAGMGEGVIVNVLTDLVTAFSADVAKAVDELPSDASGEDPVPDEPVVAARPAPRPAAQAPAADAVEAVAAGDDALELIRRRVHAALGGAPHAKPHATGWVA